MPPAFTSAATVMTRENMVGIVYRPVAADPAGGGILYSATIGGPDAAWFMNGPNV